MAIKIRCSECSKKISIDEAFAGGVCRCPYCRAIVVVPESGSAPPGARAERPAAPVDQSAQPTEPTAAPQAPTKATVWPGSGQAQGGKAPSDELPVVPRQVLKTPATEPLCEQAVPMARPDRRSKLVLIVLCIFIVAFIVGVVVFASRYWGKSGGEKSTPTESAADVNPFESDLPRTVGGDISVESPVVYVIDGGQSYGEMFDSATGIVVASIQTLDEKDSFALIVPSGGGGDGGTAQATTSARGGKSGGGAFTTQRLSAGYSDGGIDGGIAALAFLEGLLQDGKVGAGRADSLGAIRQAMRLTPRPRTIVLFMRRNFTDESGQKLHDAAQAVVDMAKDQGIVIHALGLEPGGEAIEKTNALLSQGTGGQSRTYSSNRLNEYFKDFNPKTKGTAE